MNERGSQHILWRERREDEGREGEGEREKERGGEGRGRERERTFTSIRMQKTSYIISNNITTAQLMTACGSQHQCPHM